MAFWFWTGAAAVVIILLIAALLSSIRIRVRYWRSGQLDQLVIVIRALYGVVQTQRTIPTITIRSWGIFYEEKAKSSMAGQNKDGQDKRFIDNGTVRRLWNATKSLKLSIDHLKEWSIRTLRRVECTRWRMDVRIGTGDAAATAVLSGLFWTLMGCVNGMASQYICLRTHPHGKVEPVYNGKEFSFVWEADFRIRASELALSMIGLGARTVRVRQALRAWKTWNAGPEHA